MITLRYDLVEFEISLVTVVCANLGRKDFKRFIKIAPEKFENFILDLKQNKMIIWNTGKKVLKKHLKNSDKKKIWLWQFSCSDNLITILFQEH